jgi:hypothetical protein
MKQGISIRKLLLGFVVLCAGVAPVLAQNDDIRKLDIWIDRLCAGLFWSVHQCGALDFRAAHGRAFLAMARKAAALEGKRMPLTQDEAAQQLSEELQSWLEEIGPACETFQQLPQSDLGHLVNLNMCVRRLRGEE